jgi:hypothetical protein
VTHRQHNGSKGPILRPGWRSVGCRDRARRSPVMLETARRLRTAVCDCLQHDPPGRGDQSVTRALDEATAAFPAGRARRKWAEDWGGRDDDLAGLSCIVAELCMSTLRGNRIHARADRQRQRAADSWIELVSPRCTSPLLPQALGCVEGTMGPLARRRNANGRSA